MPCKRSLSNSTCSSRHHSDSAVGSSGEDFPLFHTGAITGNAMGATNGKNSGAINDNISGAAADEMAATAIRASDAFIAEVLMTCGVGKQKSAVGNNEGDGVKGGGGGDGEGGRVSYLRSRPRSVSYTIEVAPAPAKRKS